MLWRRSNSCTILPSHYTLDEGKQDEGDEQEEDERIKLIKTDDLVCPLKFNAQKETFMMFILCHTPKPNSQHFLPSFSLYSWLANMC